MKIGLIGLPQSGKTTVFEVLTSKTKEPGDYKEFDIAEVKVPDERLNLLAEYIKPEKITFPKVSFVDMQFSMQQIENGIEPKHLKDVDELCLVVRFFNNEIVPHPMGNIDPLRDIEIINTGIILSDMDLVQKRIDKVKDEVKKGIKNNGKELILLEKLLKELEKDLPIRKLSLSQEEEKLISGFKFLSQKPLLVVLNKDEKDLGKRSVSEKLDNWCRQQNVEVIEFCAELEKEIFQLDEKDRMEFMKELGIKESACDKFINTSYKTLNLISFFTFKGKETRAWSIPKGTSAWEAAGKIHSDIQRGFIKAEVISFNDFKEYEGSFNTAKQKGLLRLEGKDYIVQDGDIINFKFNI